MYGCFWCPSRGQMKTSRENHNPELALSDDYEMPPIVYSSDSLIYISHSSQHLRVSSSAGSSYMIALRSRNHHACGGYMKEQGADYNNVHLSSRENFKGSDQRLPSPLAPIVIRKPSPPHLLGLLSQTLLVRQALHRLHEKFPHRYQFRRCNYFCSCSSRHETYDVAAG